VTNDASAAYFLLITPTSLAVGATLRLLHGRRLLAWASLESTGSFLHAFTVAPLIGFLLGVLI
jgi:hypothetical protein